MVAPYIKSSHQEPSISASPPLRDLRAIACLIWFGLVTIAFTLAGLAGLLVLRSDAKQLRWRNYWMRRWNRSVASLTGMRLRVSGEPPAGAALLVANHTSYLDIVTLSLPMDCTFVSKNDVADWPLIGFASRRSRTIFIDRQSSRSIRSALEDIDNTLNDGLSVVLFPEGTTTSGDTVTPFRSSLLELAVAKNLPVYYASIHYQTPEGDPPARDVVCWWGDTPFFQHVFNLFRLHGFEAWVTFGPEPLHGSERKALAQDLHRAVEKQFIPSSEYLAPTTGN
jgi:1-acyl-sn-glycerol-3-phosphate acyltransferase